MKEKKTFEWKIFLNKFEKSKFLTSMFFNLDNIPTKSKVKKKQIRLHKNEEKFTKNKQKLNLREYRYDKVEIWNISGMAKHHSELQSCKACQNNLYRGFMLGNACLCAYLFISSTFLR